MNVSLTPELEAYVQSRVKSGLYTSASEVVREALRFHQNRDPFANLDPNTVKREIQKGLDDVEAGRVTSGTAEEHFERLKERMRSRFPDHAENI